MTKIEFDPLFIAENVPGWMARPELKCIISQAKLMPKNGTYIEVGTWRGRSYMAAGLSLPPDSRLVGIDTFAGDGTGAHNLAAMAPEFVELCANSVREYVQLKNDISAELIKNTSEEAVKLFKDESADMVFVDAAHDYDAAKKDMEIWWHKVKQGGLLFGHDYHVAHKGVRAAVIEFAANNNVEFTSPKKTTIWMIRKP